MAHEPGTMAWRYHPPCIWPVPAPAATGDGQAAFVARHAGVLEGEGMENQPFTSRPTVADRRSAVAARFSTGRCRVAEVSVPA